MILEMSKLGIHFIILRVKLIRWKNNGIES